MKRITLILFAASLMLACKNKKASGGWPQSSKDAFIDNCVKGATGGGMEAEKAKSYCNCVEGKMEVKYPKAEDVGKIDMNTMTDMEKDCLK